MHTGASVHASQPDLLGHSTQTSLPLLVVACCCWMQVLCCAVSGESDVIIGGKSLVKFLTLPGGGNNRGDVQSKKGIFGRAGAACATAVSAAWLGAHAVTGMADGSLYLWKVGPAFACSHADDGRMVSPSAIQTVN